MGEACIGEWYARGTFLKFEHCLASSINVKDTAENTQQFRVATDVTSKKMCTKTDVQPSETKKCIMDIDAVCVCVSHAATAMRSCTSIRSSESLIL